MAYQEFELSGSSLLGAHDSALPTEQTPAPTRRARQAFRLISGGIAAVGVLALLAVCSAILSGPPQAPLARLREGDDTRTFDESGRFIMRDFDRMKPMSSFLPGVAGLWGIPMWLFYVNRGQGVATFGIEDKNGGILMFQTAEKAYQVTPFNGFRTLLKVRRGEKTKEAQPFMPEQDYGKETTPRRDMFIGTNEMEIEEADPETGIRTNALYFTPPNEDFPALVRRVTFTNVGTETADVEVIDGLAKLEPHGTTFGQLTAMGRTIEGWMHVYNFDKDHTRPFFHLVTTPADTADVALVKAGHFVIGFIESEDNVGEDSGHELLDMICDQQLVFGSDTTLSVPRRFFGSASNSKGASVSDILKQPQSTTSRTPSAMAATSFSLAPGESKTMSIIYGHAPDLDAFLTDIAPQIVSKGYISRKRTEAQALTTELTDRVYMSSGVPLMDNYVKQNYLDNALRGGMPFEMGGGAGRKPKIYHAFSRIHGDLERDYNNFLLQQTYFSQGPGNFRDVNQNRRCDVLQLPSVHDFNVRQFLSYVQADGYNQLTVATAFFKINEPYLVREVASRLAAPGLGLELVRDLLAQPFRPGQLFKDMQDAGIKLMLPREELLELVTRYADQVPAGQYAQNGFWTDHFTYNLDLVKNFLAVYPDEKESMLWDSAPVPFFMSPGRVANREEKNMLADNEGTVRQYDAVFESPAKLAALSQMWGDPNYVGDKLAGAMWQRTKAGGVMTVPIISKLVLLAANKFAILDPLGMGVEMEAGKPGWNDAMNGLPGPFGSEMPSAFELHEIVDFVGEAVDEADRSVDVPEELSVLMEATSALLDKVAGGKMDDFEYWDKVHDALEDYRSATEVTFTGKTVAWPAEALGKRHGLFGKMHNRMDEGIKRALSFAKDPAKKVSPTYFRFTVKSYELVGYSARRQLPTVKVKAFEPEALPLFLEGPTRHLKTMKRHPKEDRAAVYQAVHNSTLHDNKLHMYKISESLAGQPFEVGRMMAFNPGWLENESVWMHMSYKWYLELLRAGLFAEFYKEIQTGVACFMDPKVFGRSPLEAASFIVSSAFPEEQLHGSGFLARLSGSTAEFLSMWNMMMFGETPFSVDKDGALQLTLMPAVASWMWREDGTITFKFLGAVDVTYVYPAKKDSWTASVASYELYASKEDTDPVRIDSGVVPAKEAAAVRDLKYEAITVTLE